MRYVDPSGYEAGSVTWQTPNSLKDSADLGVLKPVGQLGIDFANGLINKNAPLEQQAKQAFNLRNQFRTQARDFMSDRELANKLMKEEPNLKWNQVVQKAKDQGYTVEDIYNYIIDSSQRSRTSVNQSLGT